MLVSVSAGFAATKAVHSADRRSNFTSVIEVQHRKSDRLKALKSPAASRQQKATLVNNAVRINPD